MTTAEMLVNLDAALNHLNILMGKYAEQVETYDISDQEEQDVEQQRELLVNALNNARQLADQ